MSDLADPFCFELSIPDGYEAITSGDCLPVGGGVYLAPFGCHVVNATGLQQNVGSTWVPQVLREKKPSHRHGFKAG